jgi:phospholipid/cholesterol/gamma-HCH transport system permease protein
LFSAPTVEVWDSTLVSLVYSISKYCLNKNISVDHSGLPVGLQGLIKLAFAVEPQKTSSEQTREPFFSRIGLATLETFETTQKVLGFIGEITLAFVRFVFLKAKIRKSDFLEIVQQAGPAGLPIVGLISFLVGLILAYIGAIQLKQFGAQIFVANLVGIAMAREMGGIMASIIMAGRTGAAFAAQLGTMQVNEEIDALKTVGISPIEFLVLPRMLALILMNPLVCLYAILAGILGGLVVSVGVLNIPLPLYWDQTIHAIKLADVCVGVFKSIFFGILVALCGCYHGIRCGRSASAVGEATTAAVVSSIVCVVVADAIFAVLTNIMGI